MTKKTIKSRVWEQTRTKTEGCRPVMKGAFNILSKIMNGN